MLLKAPLIPEVILLSIPAPSAAGVGVVGVGVGAVGVGAAGVGAAGVGAGAAGAGGVTAVRVKALAAVLAAIASVFKEVAAVVADVDRAVSGAAAPAGAPSPNFTPIGPRIEVNARPNLAASDLAIMRFIMRLNSNKTSAIILRQLSLNPSPY
ncbi:hypothetical protein, partial [Thermococcus sp.]|uniref:hypothetical protein n=1 Tax=Thermococcus sp. TaxID=35749 RepID=UPI00260A7AAB